ncbi:hypothetical protein OROMI_005164 [Orobanche minor]
MQIVNRIHVLVPGEDTREKQELQDREIKKRVGRFVVWSVEMLVFWGMVRQQAPFDAQKDVMKKLKLKYEVDVHEGILQCIMGGGENACHSEPCLSKLILNNGCNVREIGCNTVVASLIGKYILDSIKREDADSLSSDPIILVLDKEVQMLPWENLPV